MVISTVLNTQSFTTTKHVLRLAHTQRDPGALHILWIEHGHIHSCPLKYLNPMYSYAATSRRCLTIITTKTLLSRKKRRIELSGLTTNRTKTNHRLSSWAEPSGACNAKITQFFLLKISANPDSGTLTFTNSSIYVGRLVAGCTNEIVDTIQRFKRAPAFSAATNFEYTAKYIFTAWSALSAAVDQWTGQTAIANRIGKRTKCYTVPSLAAVGRMRGNEVEQ